MQISIKGARVEKNLTQKQAAKEMKVTRETISNWEKGVTAPTAPHYCVYVKFMGWLLAIFFYLQS